MKAAPSCVYLNKKSTFIQHVLYMDDIGALSSSCQEILVYIDIF
jgi:hypothetical protein